jgi:hypothetical protein
MTACDGGFMFGGAFKDRNAAEIESDMKLI